MKALSFSGQQKDGNIRLLPVMLFFAYLNRFIINNTSNQASVSWRPEDRELALARSVRIFGAEQLGCGIKTSTKLVVKCFKGINKNQSVVNDNSGY
ncbi:hypothetical protein MKW98_002494 [Papaver atlanticum]|uniref:Uncharacterized protein n=1 Tax=Papaver atlanticum TaxID=357466 RepID=A0AAD4SC91_9MAGN|nr:hypothetical protein MKW98_002494 [Papaver atlanticum]